MTFQARWHREAVTDLREGFNWYEEREQALGQALTRAANEAVESVVRSPRVPRLYEHPNLPVGTEVRRIQLTRFNEYSLTYAIVNEAVWILAVAHSKRRSGYWIDRLRTLP